MDALWECAQGNILLFELWRFSSYRSSTRRDSTVGFFYFVTFKSLCAYTRNNATNLQLLQEIMNQIRILKYLFDLKGRKEFIHPLRSNITSQYMGSWKLFEGHLSAQLILSKVFILFLYQQQLLLKSNCMDSFKNNIIS